MSVRRLIASAACLLVCVWMVGCHKQESHSVTNAETNAVALESSTVAPEAPPTRGPGPMPARPPGAAVVSDQGGINATLEQLSLELRKYVVRSRSVPKTYEEFIAKSNVHAPPPPEGKKYVIENQAIV